MRTMFCYVLLAVTTVCSVVAQSVAVSDDSFFRDLSSLREQGHHYYLMGNRGGLLSVIGAFQQTVDRRKAAGWLNESITDSLQNVICRLEGYYHYENASTDTLSYLQAERCFLSCLRFARAHTQHPTSYRDRFIVCQELSQLYYKQRRYTEALDYMRQAYRVAANYCSPDDDELLDLTGQLAICLARVGDYRTALEYIDETIAYYEHTESERYGEALRRKAKILMLQRELSKEDIAETVRCYRRYFALKREDALANFSDMTSLEREEYWSSIRLFVTDCYAIEGADAQLLYDVVLFSKALLLQIECKGGGLAPLTACWQDIQHVLSPTACAIEFLQYEKCGQKQMAAVVVGKVGEPKFVPMPRPDSVFLHRIGNRTVADCLYNTNGEVKNDLYSDSLGLFRQIWNDSLMEAMGEVKEVFFAPDGYLHQLAIEFMLPETMKDVKVHRLTSTRQLLTVSDPHRQAGVLVVGDIDYQCNSREVNKGNDFQAYNYVSQRRFHFSPLKNSRLEIDTIAAIWSKQMDRKLSGVQATESNFRTLCGKSGIIHISSHGLFGAASIVQGTDLKPCVADSTLSECVIALSGAQRSISDSLFDGFLYDGLLSAKEISSLDLSRTELVVLACCETGLGYITAEGVYGIQRGLKNAGAKAIIVSLWDVDDRATTCFMTALHSSLSKGLSVFQSFEHARTSLFELAKQAQERMDDADISDEEFMECCEVIDFYLPRYSNAFVLIDAM